MATVTADSTKVFLDTLRPEVRTLPRYNAGLSIDYVRARYGVERIAKLGSNENPYGASPKAMRAVAEAAPEIAIYPEPCCDGLREVLAAKLNVDPARLIFGNGSEDLIAIATHTFLAPGSRVVTFAPSFGLHVIWPQSVGAEVHAVRVRDDYRMDIDEVLSAVTPETRMVMFGNPSNPVGTSLTAGDFMRLLAHLSPKTLLIFDEAYLEYASASAEYPDFLAMLGEAETPWIVLRTLSKAYGLAGLRIGYGIASSPELIGLMDRVRAPFNVNRLAQIAAIAALEDVAHVEEVARNTVDERERMRAALEARGYRVAPSLTNFLFVRARENANELAERLMPHGVIVKPWREPGFEDHVRVSIGTPETSDQFFAAWDAVAQ